MSLKNPKKQLHFNFGGILLTEKETKCHNWNETSGENTHRDRQIENCFLLM